VQREFQLPLKEESRGPKMFLGRKSDNHWTANIIFIYVCMCVCREREREREGGERRIDIKPLHLLAAWEISSRDAAGELADPENRCDVRSSVRHKCWLRGRNCKSSHRSDVRFV